MTQCKHYNLDGQMLIHLSIKKNPLFFKFIRCCFCTVMVTALPLGAESESDAAEPVQVLDTFELRTLEFRSLAEDFAQPTLFLDAAELAPRLETSIGETLEGLPGISSTSYFPGASRPIIRGFSNDRIRILSNGIDTLDASVGSHDHSVALEPHLIEEIELVRGPATLLYGSNAVGGVINATNRRIARQRAGADLTGTLRTEYSSAADGWTHAGYAVGDIGPMTWSLTGLVRRHGDIDIPGAANADPELNEGRSTGTLENSFVRTQDWSGGLSYIQDHIVAGISLSGFNTNYGIGFETENDVAGVAPNGSLIIERELDDRVEIDVEQIRVDALLALLEPFSWAEELRFRFGWSDYEHDELEDGEVGTTFSNQAFEGRVEIEHVPWLGNLEGAIGAQFSQSKFSAIGDEAFIRPNRTRKAGLFFFEELPVGEWTLQFGARVEAQRITVSGFDRDALPAATGKPDNFSDYGLSGSLGFIRPLNDTTTLSLNLSYTERLPSAQELYADGPHIGTFAFERSDALDGSHFKTEDSIGIDVGLSHSSQRFTAESSIFYQRFDNFINLRRTDELAFENNDGSYDIVRRQDVDNSFIGREFIDVTRYQQVDAHYYGLEGSLTYHALSSESHSLDLTLGGDLVRASERSSGENLSRIPPARLSAEVIYRNWPIEIGARHRYIFSQDRTAANETSTAGYQLTSLNAAYRFGDTGQGTVFLRVDNLFDNEARSHTSFVKDSAPLAGRNLRLGVAYAY
ncbi:MAG: TonB-dependent receptor [Puniceicoccaceae bacterium]|nr:MAG: TonB-dependent receptor [Puniceicoccaceae bacterium]